MYKNGVCKICGKEFTKVSGNQVLCSVECRKKQQKISNRKHLQKKHPQPKAPEVKEPADKTTIYDMVNIMMMLSKERGRRIQYGALSTEIQTGKLKVKGGVIV